MAILEAKFKRSLAACQTLGGLLAHYVERYCEIRPTRLLPVPLHPSRLRIRGYNQAEEIARSAGKILNLPVDTTIIIRNKNTNTQSALASIGARRANVRNAFEVAERRLPHERFALVDDVCTSTATIDACMQSLRRVHPFPVDAWIVARAPKDI